MPGSSHFQYCCSFCGTLYYVPLLRHPSKRVGRTSRERPGARQNRAATSSDHTQAVRGKALYLKGSRRAAGDRGKQRDVRALLLHIIVDVVLVAVAIAFAVCVVTCYCRL